MTNPTTTHLSFTAGTTPDGKTIVRDFARIPHVLVCGSTGSGKSNFLHSLIRSLVRDHSPDDVRFLLADPKRVEFSPYAALPHLLAPVIRDSTQAVQALRRLDGEMSRRGADGSQTERPRIVVIIDEFSDFMIQEREIVEPLVTRVATSGAAGGIHLVIATSRPASTVFTNGLLAAIPARLVFRLVGADDFAKRVGAPGAKDLAGRGDGFWREPCGELLRVRTPFVSEDEIGIQSCTNRSTASKDSRHEQTASG